MKQVDLWHDRAVLHFFTSEEHQNTYFQLLKKLVKVEGFVILAEFNLEGAKKCSGLDVFKNTHKFMEVQQSEFSEIKQGAQMLKHGKKHHKDACKLFLKFLKSKKSKAILSDFGYFVK